MNILQAQQLRMILGWLTAALLFACLACLADALAAGFKGETRIFQAIPGATLPVTAHLPPGAATLAETRVVGGDDSVALVAEELFSGFWLGGTMWRGSVIVSPDALPGTWRLTLEGPPLIEKPKGALPITFTITVHPDALAMQQASPSLVMRMSGYEPSMLSLLFFCLALPGGLGGFLLSGRIERLLTLEGKAIVYMVKKSDGDTLISFSLGLEHGLGNGMSIHIVDQTGREVGEARVTESKLQDSTAKLVSGVCAIGDLAILPNGDVPRQGANTYTTDRP